MHQEPLHYICTMYHCITYAPGTTALYMHQVHHEDTSQVLQSALEHRATQKHTSSIWYAFEAAETRAQPKQHRWTEKANRCTQSLPSLRLSGRIYAVDSSLHIISCVQSTETIKHSLSWGNNCRTTHCGRQHTKYLCMDYCLMNACTHCTGISQLTSLPQISTVQLNES